MRSIRTATLVHGTIDRLAVAMQNEGDYLPPRVSVFLGDGTAPPPRPDTRTDPEGTP